MVEATLIDIDVEGNTSTSYSMHFNNFVVGLSAQATANPLSNGNSLAEVSKSNFENATIGISGFLLTEEEGYLTYTKILELIRRPYNPLKFKTKLFIDYGVGTPKVLPNTMGQTNGIYVVLSGADIDMGLMRLPQFNQAAGVGSLSFVETR